MAKEYKLLSAERDELRNTLTRVLYGDDDGSTRIGRLQEAVELLDRLGDSVVHRGHC